VSVVVSEDHVEYHVEYHGVTMVFTSKGRDSRIHRRYRFEPGEPELSPRLKDK
jgi:hypothetical protein